MSLKYVEALLYSLYKQEAKQFKYLIESFNIECNMKYARIETIKDAS